jgi:hypothetical protein
VADRAWPLQFVTLAICASSKRLCRPKRVETGGKYPTTNSQRPTTNVQRIPPWTLDLSVGCWIFRYHEARTPFRMGSNLRQPHPPGIRLGDTGLPPLGMPVFQRRVPDYRRAGSSSGNRSSRLRAIAPRCPATNAPARAPSAAAAARSSSRWRSACSSAAASAT